MTKCFIGPDCQRNIYNAHVEDINAVSSVSTNIPIKLINTRITDPGNISGGVFPSIFNLTIVNVLFLHHPPSGPTSLAHLTRLTHAPVTDDIICQLLDTVKRYRHVHTYEHTQDTACRQTDRSMFNND